MKMTRYIIFSVASFLGQVGVLGETVKNKSTNPAMYHNLKLLFINKISNALSWSF